MLRPDPDKKPNRFGEALGSPFATIAMGAALAALVLVYYACSYASLADFARVLDEEQSINIDFVRHYYPAGREIFLTGLPAEGFCYSAFFALCLGPLSWLDLGHATWVWTGLQLASVAVLLVVPAAAWLRDRRGDCYLYLLLTLLSAAVLYNFMWGQVSVALTVCVLGVLYLYRRGRTIPAAVLLALVTAAKFYPAIFGIYFLLKRQWRLLAVYAVATGVFLVAVPAAVLGPGGLLRYQRALDEGMRTVRGLARIDSNSQYFPHVLAHYAGMAQAIGEGVRKQPPHSLGEVSSRILPEAIERYKQIISRPPRYPWFWPAIGYALFAANVLLLRRIVRAGVSGQEETAFALLFLSLPLLLSTSWPHYFAYLPFCQVLVWRLIRQGGFYRRLCYGLLGWSVLLSSAVVFNATGSWAACNFGGLLFWSNSLLLGLLYLQILPRLRSVSDARISRARADCANAATAAASRSPG